MCSSVPSSGSGGIWRMLLYGAAEGKARGFLYPLFVDPNA